jgi:hypothetical protein
MIRTVGLAALVVAAGAAVPAAAAPDQRSLVILRGDHVARAAPSATAQRLAVVDGRRPLTGVRTVLPVLDRRTGWVRVTLPGRPNGLRGWIRRARTLPTSTGWRIAVDLSARRVTVYQHGMLARRFPAVVGTAWTPTPRGRFFIEEALALSSSAAGGPFALATSARSNVLQEFEGGPGQIALHGTNYLGDPLGSAASHGCIRLSTSAITWLSQRIGAGVPLAITA